MRYVFSDHNMRGCKQEEWRERIRNLGGLQAGGFEGKEGVRKNMKRYIFYTIPG